MNTLRTVGWGCWGLRGQSGISRVGVIPRQVMVLGALGARLHSAPTAPRLNAQRGQLQASLLLTAPTVPTPRHSRSKVAGRDPQTNDSTYWS